MHKFFCNYNALTGKYELSNIRSFRNNALIQAETGLINEIKNNIQQLYENVVFIKDKEENEEKLLKLDDIELMISNLYYSLFSSPLELADNSTQEISSIKNCIELIDKLIEQINIQEQSRLCQLIKNNLTALETSN